MNNSDKCIAARLWKSELKIVSVEWLLACLKEWKRVDEEEYIMKERKEVVSPVEVDEDEISTADEEGSSPLDHEPSESSVIPVRDPVIASPEAALVGLEVQPPVVSEAPPPEALEISPEKQSAPVSLEQSTPTSSEESEHSSLAFLNLTKSPIHTESETVPSSFKRPIESSPEPAKRPAITQKFVY